MIKVKKCVILLPTAYNDGALIPPAVLQGIFKEFDRKFDGYSIDGPINGTYKMDDGSVVRDKSIRVWFMVDPLRIDELKGLARGIARTLKQESIYFEVTEAEIELIRPLPEMGESS
jgi:hypothetical protein